MVSRIDALAGHIGRLLVFLVDLQEARRLALGLGDRLLLVALGALQNALGLAARLRHDLLGVGKCLVLQALLVGARSLHVAEGIDHLCRRVDLLQLHLVDADAGTIVSSTSCIRFCTLCSVFCRASVRMGWILFGRRSRAWRSRPPLSRCCRGSEY